MNVPLSAVAAGSSVTATASDAAGDPGMPSSAVSVHLSGDVTGDGTVDFSDLLALAQHYNSPAEPSQGDINGDGVVDFKDLLLLAQNYGRSAATSALAAFTATGSTRRRMLHSTRYAIV